MDLIKTMDIAASGMTAQRTRMNVISTNLANANTTRTAAGGPYRRRTVIFQTTPVGVDFRRHFQRALTEEPCGVEVTEIVSGITTSSGSPSSSPPAESAATPKEYRPILLRA